MAKASSKRSSTKRESPTYVRMGIDGEMLVRMQSPIKQRAEKVYEKLYEGVPGPGMGQFIGFLISGGLDPIEKKLGIASKAASAPAK